MEVKKNARIKNESNSILLFWNAVKSIFLSLLIIFLFHPSFTYLSLQDFSQRKSLFDKNKIFLSYFIPFCHFWSWKREREKTRNRTEKREWRDCERQCFLLNNWCNKRGFKTPVWRVNGPIRGELILVKY